MRAALVGTVLTLTGLWISTTSPVLAGTAGPTGDGQVVIVNANNRTRPLQEGDSNTIFSLRLPDGATCPGDSANDDWRIQSFIIPASVDPGSIVYGDRGPVGEGMHSLRLSTTRPWVQELLLQNPGPGEPGVIGEPPPLIFGVVAESGLADGDYRVGVVCTYFGEPSNYWDAQITVTTVTDVPQSGVFQPFDWELVPEAGVQSSKTGTSSNAIPILMVGAAAIATGILFVRVRRRRQHRVKETV